MTDVFLTQGYFIHEDVKEQEIMRPYPPLGLLYISGHLKREGIDTYLFDSTFSSKEEQRKQLLLHQPKLVAIYVNLMTKINVLELVKFIHKELPQTKVALGGPDVSYNLENYLKNGADFLTIGEGENTVKELANYIISGEQNLSEIEGLAYLIEGKVHKNAPRQKVKDLSDLVLPDRASINFEQYLDVWEKYHGKRTANLSTQRGCPYTCKWCSTAVYGQSYRRRPAHLVADEIELLKTEYGVEALWFVDDVFTVSHKWLNELYAEFKKRNLVIDFEIITRAERLNDEVLQQLKEMGCFRIWIGAESGSQRIIDLMDRRVDINLVKDMMLRTQDYGMESGTFIMVGYPSETLADVKQTATYLKNAKPSLLTITKTYPIKGTALYQEVKDKLTVEPDWATSTDRDIEFELPYSKRFYKYAIRYIINEYNFGRAQAVTTKLKTFIKAKLAFLILKLG